MSVYLQILVGLGAVVLLSFGVRPLLERAKRDARLIPPTEALKDKWAELTGGNEGGAIIGWLERFLFFCAFWVGAPEAIGVWLAFKVASKWEVWSNVVSLPDSLPGVEQQLDYLIARRRWSSNLLITFLVGTLANVLIGFLGVVVGRHGYEAVCAMFC